MREALRELGPNADPGRYAYLLARLSRTIWQLNKGVEAVAAAERALAILPEDEPAAESVPGETTPTADATGTSPA